MKYTFSKKLFNPNFWHFFKEMQDATRRFIFGYGGSSSSKTYSFVQALVILLLTKGEDAIVFRKVGATIDDTVFKDFRTVIDSLGLANHFKIIKHRIICIDNGKDIAFKGLDDKEKIKGITVKRVFCNELNAFDKSEYDQIRKRLRGQPGQQILCDFNPIDKEHWIKKELFDTIPQNPMECILNLEGIPTEFTLVTEKWQNSEQEINFPDGLKVVPPNFVCIRSTYLNNFWIVGSPDKTFGFVDEQTIIDFEKDKDTDLNFYNVYALGLWGSVRVGGEFYKSFNINTNVKKLPYRPELPLHLTFDFNVNPGMHALILQVEGKKIWQVGEIKTVSPRNKTEGVCAVFKDSKFGTHANGLYIYGDPGGKKEDTRTEKGHNDFEIIRQQLIDYRPTFRVPSAYPVPKTRGDFINRIFESGFDGIEIWLNPDCNITIDDFQNVKEKSDGSKLHEKVKDPITKVAYEKWSHCFVGETLITTIEGQKRIDNIKTGEYVLTRNGYKKVLQVFNNGIKQVNTYIIDNKKITCTSNHKYYSYDKDNFIEIYSLHNDIIQNEFCILQKNDICKKKSFVITDEDLQGIQILKGGVIGCILMGMFILMELKLKCVSMFINGFVNMDKYQQDMKYIILTTIPLIIILTIWNVLQLKIINDIITQIFLKSTKIFSKIFWLQKLKRKLKIGTNLMKGMNGTLNMPKQLLIQKGIWLNVKNAIMNLWDLMVLAIKRFFVAEDVRTVIMRELIEGKGNGKKHDNVQYVDVPSKQIDGQKLKHVQENVAEVYDLQVEDEHEYFANEILVHNCSDAFDYFITEAFKADYIKFQKGPSSGPPRMGRPAVSDNTY